MEALHRKLAVLYTPEDFEPTPISPNLQLNTMRDSLRVEPTTPVRDMETPPLIQPSPGPRIEWSESVEGLDITVERFSRQVHGRIVTAAPIRAFRSAKLQPLATKARLVQCLTNPHEREMILVKWEKHRNATTTV